jgi:hypothetical protein
MLATLQQAIRGATSHSSPISLHQSQLSPAYMYSRPNPFDTFGPTAATSSSSGGYNNVSSHNPISRRRGPQSAANRLPEAVLLRLLSHCDETTLLDLALVSRYWLVLSRRVYFAAFAINSGADFRLLLTFLQSPGSTVHASYVTRLDISFTSDESSGSSGYTSRHGPSHITASDVHQLLRQLGSVESIKADWIGTRGSSTPRGTIPPVNQRPQTVPSFLSITHILQGLRYLEIRGGSWPFDSFLQTIWFMPKLVTLSLENIHEPGNIASTLPTVTPTFQLRRLSLGRCTISGESIGWLLSSSHQSLHHLVINSIRRRAGSSSFNSVLSMVGPALETLRVRNYVELTRWDAESLVSAGLGFCPNLRVLAIWCDVAQPNAFGSSARRSPVFTPSQFPPPVTSSPLMQNRSSPRQYGQYSQGTSLASPHIRTSPTIYRAPTTSSPHPQSSLLGSPTQSYTPGLGLSFNLDPTSDPLGSMVGSPSSRSALLTAVPPSPGSMLPTLVNVIQQGWLPHLQRLAIPTTQIELCPSRVECQAELLIRGIALDGDW